MHHHLRAVPAWIAEIAQLSVPTQGPVLDWGSE
jgi:hypothetical protein